MTENDDNIIIIDLQNKVDKAKNAKIKENNKIKEIKEEKDRKEEKGKELIIENCPKYGCYFAMIQVLCSTTIL
jgi:hypothetical protein